MLICEGLFFVVGLVALIAGQFRLYGKRTVQGTRARVVGLILMVPGPLALLMGLVLGASGAATEAAGALSAFGVMMVVAAFVVAAIVTLTTPEAPTAAAPSSVSTLSTATSFASGKEPARAIDRAAAVLLIVLGVYILLTILAAVIWMLLIVFSGYRGLG